MEPEQSADPVSRWHLPRDNGEAPPAAVAEPTPPATESWIPDGLSPTAADHAPSLALLIRSGDPDALAGLLDRRAGSVERFGAELCRPELVRDAAIASFVDFSARLTEAEADVDVDVLLLKATRGAAAGRAEVRPDEQASPAAQALCLAMPELLAARANDELRAGSELDGHLESCATCQAMAERMARADAAYEDALGAEASPEIRAAVLRTLAPESEVEPITATEPPAAPTGPPVAPVARPSIPPPTPPAPPAPQTIIVRRRSGGLLGPARDAWTRRKG